MDGIGQRIAAYRRRAGLSQAVLAGLVGRSESWLSQVERGSRSVDRLSVLLDLANALRVSVDSLVGVPVGQRVDTTAGHPDPHQIDPVRAALQTHAGLISQPSAPTDMLTDTVVSLHRRYQAAEYDQLLAELPDLIDQLDQLDPSAAAEAVEGWALVSKTLHKLGERELAASVGDRTAVLARTAGTSRAHGLAARQVAEGLYHRGEHFAAQALAVESAEHLSAAEDADQPDVLSLRGSLLLLAAVITARHGSRFDALSLLDQADNLAQQLGHDGNHAWTAFGPANVRIHAVSIAAAIGDAGEAVRAARDFDPAQLPAELSSRRAQLHVDLAWAYAAQHRDTDALLQLLEIEAIAPQLIRHHHALRTVVRDLIARSRVGGATHVLTGLAERAGIWHRERA